MNDVAKIIKLNECVKSDETTVLGSEECVNQLHIKYLYKHARTMCMMYEASNDKKYLKQARLTLEKARSIKEVGFIRQWGVLLAS